jgi:two-component system alkaline phosphatase synthesis response regulator PhoP
MVTRILVADDEEGLLELIRFTLDGAGYQVITARNGQEALNQALTAPFDLIILDVMMPLMDGYHVAREVSENPKSPPILLLTSRDFDTDQAAVQGCGATAFLSKPFEVSELLSTAQDLITNSKNKV